MASLTIKLKVPTMVCKISSLWAFLTSYSVILPTLSFTWFHCFHPHLFCYYSLNTPSSFPSMSPFNCLKGPSLRCLHSLLPHFMQSLLKCHLLSKAFPDQPTLKQPVLLLQPTLVFFGALVTYFVSNYLLSHWNINSLMPWPLSLLFTIVYPAPKTLPGIQQGSKNVG